jgi:SAM-dependent methyltransferase
MSIFSENIINKINNGWPADTSDLEFEIRFKEYQIPNKYGSQIKISTFSSLKHKLTNLTPADLITFTNSVVYIDSATNIRAEQYKNIGGIEGNDGELIFSRKNNLIEDIILTPDFPIKISMIQEEKLVLTDEEYDNFRADLIRIKNRTSFPYGDGSFRADLTQIITKKNEEDDGIISYEIELELVNKFVKFITDDVFISFYKLVYDTQLIYTMNEYKEVVEWTNKSLDVPTVKGSINFTPLYQARNLHIYDMVVGGIVSSGIVSNDSVDDNVYTVTHKTDGVRKLLVLRDDAIWLVMSPNKINKIALNQSDRRGYIFDGELVPIENRKNLADTVIYRYYVFDTLVIPFSKDTVTASIQNRSHRDRMLKADFFTMENDKSYLFFHNNILTVSTKNFKALTLTGDHEFFKVMNEMEATKELLPYDTDGYIFTSESMPYNSGNDKHPIYQRKLTDMKDICKWKSPEQITIDFLIKHSPNNILLYSIDNEEYVKFEGNDNTPFIQNEYSVDNESEITKNLPDNTIVEYKFYIDTVNPNNSKFIPIRVRDDKPKPNSLEVAKDNWSMIHDPIKLSTLLGKDMILMRKYHNRIKDLLFKLPCSYNNSHGDNYGKTLLDIGSGMGGDLNKMKEYSKVILVEPNLDNISELIQRLENRYKQYNTYIISSDQDDKNVIYRVKQAVNSNHKFIIVNTGGENTNLINTVRQLFIQDKVDVVSSMLSMSFFWKSKDMVNSLVETIGTSLKPTGKFIYLTIDGDLVKEFFSPTYSKTDLGTKVDFDFGSLEVDLKTNKVIIDLPNTIVGRQEEYLVILDDLRLGLLKYGFTVFRNYQGVERYFKTVKINENLKNVSEKYVSNTYRADQNLFLNYGEKQLSSLYSYGCYSQRKAVSLISQPYDLSQNKILNYKSYNLISDNKMDNSFDKKISSNMVQPEISTSTISTSNNELFNRPNTTLQQKPLLPLSPISQKPLLPLSPISQKPLLPLSPISQKPLLPLSPISQKPLSPLSPISQKPLLPLLPISQKPQILLPLQEKSLSQKPKILVLPLQQKPLQKSLQPLSPLKPLQQKPLQPLSPLKPLQQKPLLPLSPIQTLKQKPLLPLSPIQPLHQNFIVPYLPVTRVYDRSKRYYIGQGDDYSEQINVSWYKHSPVVRIAVIGDGSCMIHAILKAFHLPYANTDNYDTRTSIVAKFRRDIAALLSMEDTRYTDGSIYYDTYSNGLWREFSKNEAIDVDFSLDGMQKLFNSNNFLGEEVLKFISNVFTVVNNITNKDIIIDIYVFVIKSTNLSDPNQTDLTFHISTATNFENQKNKNRYGIFIAGNTQHYELIGVEGQEGIQTIFNIDDQIMQSYWAKLLFSEIKTDYENIIKIGIDDTTKSEIQLFYDTSFGIYEDISNCKSNTNCTVQLDDLEYNRNYIHNIYTKMRK